MEQLLLGVPLPPDEDARVRIRTDLATTLFVEAGAGSGKTTALVSRVLALVRAGIPLRSIAAITFTEKAGRELRDRLRRDFEGEADVFRVALDDLDGAAIGTLHAFAQRLLSENPVEAGLPPAVDVLDEVTSGLAFERRWASFRDALLADPAHERTILLFLAAGPKEDALRVLARAFDDNWDLVEARVPLATSEPPPLEGIVAGPLAALRAACDRRHECRAETDTMLTRLSDIETWLDLVEGAATEYDVMDLLGEIPNLSVGRCGSQQKWPDLPSLRASIAGAGDALEHARRDVADACARRLGSIVRAFTLAAATERQAAGRLEFHDLLVLARRLLADPAVCGRLHDRYQYLLLDEFQDTDPIQVELAVRIAAVTGGADPGRAWTDVEVRPGHLFVVGDPKQSIYRFRRADIGTFLDAKRRFGEERGATVELTANFRTVAPVIDWVNGVFAELMRDKGTHHVPSQPDYVPLAAIRAPGPAGPPIAVLGAETHPARTVAADLRRAEATSVAGAIAHALDEGWSVGDDSAPGGWRPARLGDITILVPARTSLPFLEDALEAAGIPFRAESSSLVYATRAVRDLLMILRAVDDPTDTLRLVAALRTPLLGCGDDDLFRFKVERGGFWSFQAVQPVSVPMDDPVAEALAYLGSLSEIRRWLAPSELMLRVAAERRAFELGFAEGRPRDVWRRLRFVIDQARSWSEATGGSLREYLAWVEQQTAEGARVSESVLPETDDDAVRVMTIHAAKGLEFPITIVSGLTAKPGGKTPSAQVVFPPSGPPGYRFGGKVETSEYEAWTPVDEQMEFHERIRLLYVACTRARDHLVVSLHRSERVNAPAPDRMTNAELLRSGMAAGGLEAPPITEPPGRRAEVDVEPPAPILDFATWKTAHDSAIAKSGRPGTVAATALTDDGAPDPGLAKRPRDLDLPPWLKGRYGSAVGRAVHGALQTVDLSTGAGVDAAVAAQCQAEAIPGQTDAVGRLVWAALRAPVVMDAAASPHWREVYACTPLGDRLLEGYIDLLYRGPEGLVVVDYKTAGTSDPDDLDRRLAGYRTQGASYALAVAAATGEPVSRVVFVFLTPAGAVERDLEDLDAAVAEVRTLVGAGYEVETA